MPKLSDTLVASLVCPRGKKDVLFFDGILPGFGVRVTASGKRIFIFQYRGATKVQRMPLGLFGVELTTVQARAKAEARRGQYRTGSIRWPPSSSQGERSAGCSGGRQSHDRGGVHAQDPYR